MRYTLDELEGLMRLRLNDSDEGNYSTAELDYCINIAYYETQMLARCHKARKVVTLGEGTHTYDCEEIFEPLEVSLAGVILTKVHLGEMNVSLEAWDTAANGTPTTWMQLTGSSIRL